MVKSLSEELVGWEESNLLDEFCGNINEQLFQQMRKDELPCISQGLLNHLLFRVGTIKAKRGLYACIRDPS